MKKITYLLFTILLCFICLNNVKASATCVYEPSYTAPYQYSITCKSNSNGNANCTIKDSYNQLSIASNAVKFSIENSCPNTIYISFEQNAIITNINTTSGEAVSLNKSKSTEETTTPNNPTNPTEPSTPDTSSEYENDSRYIQAKKEADRYCNPSNFVYYDNAKCEEAKSKMQEVKNSYSSGYNPDEFTATAFCQREETKGAFRVIGWAIFIIKILVPIILIVAGSIDIGKAIIGSKDDDLKKAIKTLAIRAIAGIIIFLIPSVLNFVLKIFNGNDIYNEASGSFGYCTHCMLEPTDDACGNLMGGK